MSQLDQKTVNYNTVHSCRNINIRRRCIKDKPKNNMLTVNDHLVKARSAMWMNQDQEEHNRYQPILYRSSQMHTNRLILTGTTEKQCKVVRHIATVYSGSVPQYCKCWHINELLKLICVQCATGASSSSLLCEYVWKS